MKAIYPSLTRSIALVVATLATFTSVASAQSSYMDTRFGVFGTGQFLGESRANLEGGTHRTDNQLPSWGGGAYFEFPISSAFSLTTEGAAVSWKPDTRDGATLDRGTFFDLTVAPRLRFPTGGESVVDETYAAFYIDFPIGFSLSITDKGYNDALNNPDADLGIGYGPHGGARAGFQVFFNKDVGFSADGGILFRGVRHQADGAGDANLDLDIGMYQITARAGLVFAL